MIRATRVFASPRSLSVFRVMTTAVAVIVRPTKVAPIGSSPKAVATPKLTVKGTIAPTMATPSERLRASKNSSGWVSTPAWNIRKKMPISASSVIASLGSMSPSTAGPTSTPTISSPMIVGSPMGRRVTATSQIPASRIRRSRAISCTWGHHPIDQGSTRTTIPRCHARNASTSAAERIRLEVGVPAPWPASDSMRISVGFAHPCAACRVAANLKE